MLGTIGLDRSHCGWNEQEKQKDLPDQEPVCYRETIGYFNYWLRVTSNHCNCFHVEARVKSQSIRMRLSATEA